jgi:hypothetical protein
MEVALAEQIQAVIDTLIVAESQAARGTMAMREQRIYFGFEYGYVEDDIAHIRSRLRYMKALAERHAVAPQRNSPKLTPRLATRRVRRTPSKQEVRQS